MSDEQIEEIRRLAATGMSTREIGAEVKLSHEQVRRYLVDVPNWRYLRTISRLRQQLVDIETAAAALGTTASRLTVQCEEGQVPGAFQVGRCWLVLVEAVEKLADRKC